jgi:hypothetical protein
VSGPRTLLLASLLALPAAGCGVSDPYDQREPTHADRPAATAEPPRAEPEPTSFPGAAATPQETLRHAAQLAGNWTSANASERYRRLSALSVDPARAEFERVAAGARTDVLQTRADSRSTATVMGVIVRGSGGVRRGIVVTRERMETPELQHLPAEYRMTLATVERWGEAWVISSWAPKP